MFLSSFENKIDKKGRVSVPAFRSYLNSLGYNGFIGYPSFNSPALEGCSQDRIEKLSNTMTRSIHLRKKEIILLHQFYLKVKIFNLTQRKSLNYSKTFRSCKIKNSILFVGLGKTFQIWEPKNFEKFKIFARKKAFQNRSNLKWENK